VLDRAQVAEQTGVVQQAVETSIALVDLVGERLILRALRALEVELGNGGLRPDPFDLLIERLELRRAAAVQQQRRAVMRERERNRAADAGRRPGHQDHATGELVGGGPIVEPRADGGR
jgi:hypothetical protein